MSTKRKRLETDHTQEEEVEVEEEEEEEEDEHDVVVTHPAKRVRLSSIDFTSLPHNVIVQKILPFHILFAVWSNDDRAVIMRLVQQRNSSGGQDCEITNLRGKYSLSLGWLDLQHGSAAPYFALLPHSNSALVRSLFGRFRSDPTRRPYQLFTICCLPMMTSYNPRVNQHADDDLDTSLIARNIFSCMKSISIPHLLADERIIEKASSSLNSLAITGSLLHFPRGISHLRNLRTLSMSAQNLTNKDLASIGQNCTHLRFLRLDTTVSHSRITLNLSLLNTCKSLVGFESDHPNINVEGLNCFLAAHPNLQSFRVRQIDFISVQCIEWPRAIRILECTESLINPQMIKSIAGLQQIEYLDLSSAGRISREKVSSYIVDLLGLPSLKFLSVKEWFMDPSPESFHVLVAALENKTLIELNLELCSINPDHFKFFHAHIQEQAPNTYNSTLRVLHIGWNSIHNEGLFQLLRHFQGLRSLGIQNDDIDTIGINMLQRRMEQNFRNSSEDEDDETDNRNQGNEDLTDIQIPPYLHTLICKHGNHISEDALMNLKRYVNVM